MRSSFSAQSPATLCSMTTLRFCSAIAIGLYLRGNRPGRNKCCLPASTSYTKNLPVGLFQVPRVARPGYVTSRVRNCRVAWRLCPYSSPNNISNCRRSNVPMELSSFFGCKQRAGRNRRLAYLSAGCRVHSAPTTSGERNGKEHITKARKKRGGERCERIQKSTRVSPPVH